jgi:GTP-binding protein EngB required for normal cell division
VTALPSVGPPQLATLSPRLDALAQLVKLGRGRDGFSQQLLDESDDVLRRAGERLRLSANHTVVALAGGTGSGKSTLFDALAGATFSPSGVTRPTTRHVHACVWGMQGAGPLLDWLGVQRRHRYARASALDSGETALNGLLLLDLPDHDSVVTASMAAVDRLSKLADMLIWVLDPQKYADASVHNRYLIPLAGHAGVFVVVLNQIDLLDDRQRADCEDDLRRLLDTEGLADTPVVAVSARTGEGLDSQRSLLAREVSARHVAGTRIAADIDAVIDGYAEYAGGPAVPEHDAVALPAPSALPAEADSGEEKAEPKPPSRPPWEISDAELAEMAAERRRPPWEDATPAGAQREQDNTVLAGNVPAGPAAELTAAFGTAVGVSAMAETLASAREAQAARYTGWPLAPLRGGRRGAGRGFPGAGGAGEVGEVGGGVDGGAAQQADVDNAITVFADAVSANLPAPWPTTVRAAARSRVTQVPAELAASVASVAPRGRKVPAWWRLFAAWQWLLTVLAAAALIWAIMIGILHGGQQKSTLLGDVSLIPWLVVMAAAMVLLGWLTASGCRNVAVLAADRERTRADEAMRDQVAAVARDLVLAPAGWEIGEYERFRRELVTAQGR